MAAIYDSAGSWWHPLGEVSELWRYRHLLQLLVRRNIAARYKRSVLGLAWTLLNPLLTMLVLTVVFSSLFAPAVPFYAVYLLSGLLLWNLVAQSALAAMNDLLWNGSLLRRMYLPRTIFAVAAVGTGVLNLLLALLPLLLVALAVGAPLRPVIWFMPVAGLLAAAFALGLALLVSVLAARFADVVDTFQVLLTMWLYLTPVFYPAGIVPSQVARWQWLNPMLHLVECFRAPLYLGQLPGPDTLAAAAAAAVGMLLLGWLAFTSQADQLTYRV